MHPPCTEREYEGLAEPSTQQKLNLEEVKRPIFKKSILLSVLKQKQFYSEILSK